MLYFAVADADCHPMRMHCSHMTFVGRGLDDRKSVDVTIHSKYIYHIWRARSQISISMHQHIIASVKIDNLNRPTIKVKHFLTSHTIQSTIFEIYEIDVRSDFLLLFHYNATKKKKEDILKVLLNVRGLMYQ